MPKLVQYTSEQIFEIAGIKRSRLSQLVNGYTNRLGAWVPPVLEEGEHYQWERREVQGTKRVIKKHVLVFSKAGLEKIKEATAKSVGRPRKSSS